MYSNNKIHADLRMQRLLAIQIEDQECSRVEYEKLFTALFMMPKRVYVDKKFQSKPKIDMGIASVSNF